jgi:hypothetical protein
VFGLTEQPDRLREAYGAGRDKGKQPGLSQAKAAAESAP